MNKEIKFDRISKDWAAYLNGQYLGNFGSYLAAEIALENEAFRMLADEVEVAA